MVKITYIEFGGTTHEVDVPVGQSLMEGARAGNVPGIAADCGGACACATCHVYLDESWVAKVSEADDLEVDMLDFAPDVVQGRSRLSCQIEVTADMDGMSVTVPENQI
ncbi:MAG: 2Fe-2S iron-sulfur cluster-binding protein [Rhodobacteraceae bacterium]|nr:2Fe-2S iron-sulfur cluster-binding protein [Paracoccaceae bacterium]